MKQVPNVLGVQSIADIVADAEYQSSGVRQYPLSGEDRRDPGQRQPLVQALMPDRRHTRMIVGMPSTLIESQRNELLLEINNAVTFAEFPAGYSVTVTGDPAFQACYCG